MSAAGQPAPMTLAQIAPELREIVRRMPALPVASATGRWLLRIAMGLMGSRRSYDGVALTKHRTAGGVHLRVFTPNDKRSGAALLWIHGGGMVIGSAVQDDQFCADAARELGLVVVSTDYRLAPECPFPAALDDCWGAWQWLHESAARFQIDPARIAVGGESAGGGLAASLVQRIHDSSGPQPRAQWLFCPMLDDRTAARRELDVVAHRIWDNRQNRYGWRAFLGQEPGAETTPGYAVPARRGDLRGLPPAWVGVGDIELFFEEDRDFAGRLTAAGVSCVLDVVSGAPHGFQSIARDTSLARAYLARARAWLAGQLSG